MLVDPKIKKINPDFLKEHNLTEAHFYQKIEDGVYYGGNFEHYFENTNDWELQSLLYDNEEELDSEWQFVPYGVCDHVKQFFEHNAGKFILEHKTRKFCVAFEYISKKHQPKSGGWRWHKWGPYIGKGEPRSEYIYDDPGFDDGVFCYHVYELKSHIASVDDESLSNN